MPIVIKIMISKIKEMKNQKYYFVKFFSQKYSQICKKNLKNKLDYWNILKVIITYFIYNSL